MNSQNIQKSYGSKAGIRIDGSEFYDVILETGHYVDLALDQSEFYDFILKVETYVDVVLDYSEYYDFELGNTLDDYDIDALISFAQNALLFEDASIFLTEDGVIIIY